MQVYSGISELVSQHIGKSLQWLEQRIHNVEF